MSVLRTATRPMLEVMGLDVIHGPPNSGRAPEMLARFRAVLDREPVLVVPTGDDVAGFERQLCDAGRRRARRLDLDFRRR